MKNISVNKVWGNAWKYYKENWLILSYSLIVPLVIGWVLSASFGSDDLKKQALTAHVFEVLAIYYVFKYLVDTLMGIGRTKINLKVIDGKNPSYGDLFNPHGVYVRYLITTLLVDLCVLGGLILLIVPGIYIGLRYAFAPALVLDKGMSIQEAFAKSTEMTAGKKFVIFKFLLVCAIYTILGLLGVVIGLIVTSALANLSFFMLYRQLLGESDKEETGGQMTIEDAEKNVLESTEKPVEKEENSDDSKNDSVEN